MSIIFILILILFLIKLLCDSLFYVWLWQAKEYRIDRMMSHLKEDKNIIIGSIVPLGLWSLSARQKISQNVNANRLHSPAAAGTMEPTTTKKIIQNNWFYVLAIILFVLYFVFFKNSLLIFQYLVLAFFLIAFLQIIKEIKKRIFLRPKPTLKVILIFLLLTTVYLLIAFCWISSFSIAEEAKLPMGSLASGIELMLFVCIVNPLVIFSIVLAINPFFDFQKKRLIKKATVKMRGLKKIKVIGITGSYGKTSTKEFLYTILSQKYKVIKTEGNNNTNIGVAYTVLNKVSDEFDYFICEMGAYKIGEVAEICSIVKPEIGILTGINEQHIDLFGSIENTRKAKFELIETLPEDGLAIINKSIKYQVLSIKVENIEYFSLDNVENIKVYQDYVEFDFQTTPSLSLFKEGSSDCHCEFSSESIDDSSLVDFNSSDKKSGGIGKLCDDSQRILKQVQNDKYRNLVTFKLNLLGKHYIENVLSAIMTAEYLGMSLEEIKNAIEKIKPTKFMMRKSDGPNGSVFIDDSYSANPDGVMAALDYLDEAYADYKKIIVFPGIIELGKESDEVHRKLFGRIGEVCDKAYILRWLHSPEGLWSRNAERLHRAKATMEPANGCEFIFEKDFDKVAKMLNEKIGHKDTDTQRLQSGDWSQQNNNRAEALTPEKKTVVLFENRGAGVVMKKIKK